MPPASASNNKWVTTSTLDVADEDAVNPTMYEDDVTYQKISDGNEQKQPTCQGDSFAIGNGNTNAVTASVEVHDYCWEEPIYADIEQIRERKRLSHQNFNDFMEDRRSSSDEQSAAAPAAVAPATATTDIGPARPNEGEPHQLPPSNKKDDEELIPVGNLRQLIKRFSMLDSMPKLSASLQANELVNRRPSQGHLEDGQAAATVYQYYSGSTMRTNKDFDRKPPSPTRFEELLTTSSAQRLSSSPARSSYLSTRGDAACSNMQLSASQSSDHDRQAFPVGSAPTSSPIAADRPSFLALNRAASISQYDSNGFQGLQSSRFVDPNAAPELLTDRSTVRTQQRFQASNDGGGRSPLNGAPSFGSSFFGLSNSDASSPTYHHSDARPVGPTSSVASPWFETVDTVVTPVQGTTAVVVSRSRPRLLQQYSAQASAVPPDAGANLSTTPLNLCSRVAVSGGTPVVLHRQHQQPRDVGRSENVTRITTLGRRYSSVQSNGEQSSA
jgi:hypothetical protein